MSLSELAERGVWPRSKTPSLDPELLGPIQQMATIGSSEAREEVWERGSQAFCESLYVDSVFWLHESWRDTMEGDCQRRSQPSVTL